MEALNNSEQWKGGDIPIKAEFTSPDPVKFNLTDATAAFTAKIRGGATIATLSIGSGLTETTATASTYIVEGKIPASATATLTGDKLTIEYIYTLTVGSFIFRGKQYKGSFTLKEPLP
jgi:hypothetical protein